MRFGLFWLLLFFLFIATEVPATTVALMNFSTDDNSYRSIQAAADFTGALQAKLASLPDVKWVARQQLDRARQELELSAMGLLNQISPIRLGKWVKADWMITGQFSLDDQNRRTLFLEITGLQHANVLASQMLVFPTNETAQIQAGMPQVDFAAKALRQLMAKARLRQKQMAGKILVAPFFFANITGSGIIGNTGVLTKGFYAALEHAAAVNGHIRLIRFPKAYQSMNESELVLNGLVEANRNAWQQTADLYVWGTYAVRQVPSNKLTNQIEIKLHVWNGASSPTVLREAVPCSFFGEASPAKMESALRHLAKQVVAHACKRTIEIHAGAIRRKIAQTLIQTYNQMTMGPWHRRNTLGPENPHKFLQAIHILETACFFDPDNANARVLYITCRWGFWMDFNSMVKNEFWSKWRRSQAWGRYVKQFGLKPSTTVLPFPYAEEGGIPEAYLQSLHDLLKMFPQWHSTNEMALEDRWQRQGVDTWLLEAEQYGFPREMPNGLAWKWKNEMEAEYWQRLVKVAEFIGGDHKSQRKVSPMLLFTFVQDILNADEPPKMRVVLLEKIWPQCVRISQQTGNQWIIPHSEEPAITELCRKAHRPEEAGQLLALLSTNQFTKAPNHEPRSPVAAATTQTPSSRRVPSPAWLKAIHPSFSMFQLSPPSVLPLEVYPSMQTISFPAQFDMQTVEQLGFLASNLLILARDERSAPSSVSNPGVSAEQLTKRGRLWILTPGATSPVLYKPELLPQNIRSFLLAGHRLWVAGSATGYLNLKTHQFRQFGLSDGFDLQQVNAVGLAANHIFAAGNLFKVCKFDPQTGRWRDLPQPPGNLSTSSESSHFLVANQRWLLSATGSLLAYNLNTRTWINLSAISSPRCAVAGGSGFWIGSDGGLQFYNFRKKTIVQWSAPRTIHGLMNPLIGLPYLWNNKVSPADLERLMDRIQAKFEEIETERVQAHTTLRTSKNTIEPLHLEWRIPGGVRAMANDGDFLWLGVGNDLLLLHKPSRSLVAYCRLDPRGWISSLAISARSVSVGMAYSSRLLVRIPKSAFLSVPKSRWVNLAISPEERERLIRGMSVRDQAMYAFYTGDDAKVVRLLEGLDPNHASLEEMFLLAFSYDTSRLDKPNFCRFWFDQIISRHPDSPWASVARDALIKNNENHEIKAHKDLLLAKYDRNHNGVLDPGEKRAMYEDPEYRREEARWKKVLLGIQIEKIMQRFDQNGDGKLEAGELEHLRTLVNLFSHAPPEMLANHKIIVAPLMSKHFPSVSVILREYDTNHDAGLEPNELKTLAQSIQKSR